MQLTQWSRKKRGKKEKKRRKISPVLSNNINYKGIVIIKSAASPQSKLRKVGRTLDDLKANLREEVLFCIKGTFNKGIIIKV